MDMFEKLSLLLKFIVLGLIQGFTEPLPISSSGHLVLIRELLHIEIKGLSFEIIVHFGSLIAIIFVYRKEIEWLSLNFVKYLINRDIQYKKDFFFVVYLIIATLTTGIIGLFLENMISTKLAKPFFIGVSLLITGFFLWVIRHLKGHRTDIDITFRDAIIIGLAQSIALIPGISRSGTTVVTAVLLGMNRQTALKFSFLLFIPVSLGITVMSISELVGDLNTKHFFIPYILAFLTAIIATYIALKWFINIMQKGHLHIFSLYCFIIGGIVILFM